MTTAGRVVVLAISIALAPTLAGAQSADLVLCDQLAADPADPDKPADAKAALERLRCPYAIEDKRGNVVTNPCL